jgi:hypothetical protein
VDLFPQLATYLAELSVNMCGTTLGEEDTLGMPICMRTRTREEGDEMCRIQPLRIHIIHW